MTQDYKMEEYLRNALTDSIFPSNQSDDVKHNERSFSHSYFEDLKERLLIEYNNKSLNDVHKWPITIRSSNISAIFFVPVIFPIRKRDRQNFLKVS